MEVRIMSKFGVGKWKVTTIDCGWHIGNKVNLTPGRDDHPVKLPYLAFLLQDGEKTSSSTTASMSAS